MNTLVLVGNIGQHPVLRYTASGTPVANVTLATNRVYRDRDGNRQQSTEWHRLTVWGEGARNFAEIVSRGDLVSVRGRLEYREREIAGQKVQDASIRVAEWTKLSPRKAQQDGAADGEEGPGEGVTLETEIEGATFEGDEALATDPEPAEVAATGSSEEILMDGAPEEESTPVTRARRRKK